MSTLISTWSDEPIGAEEEQQILAGKLVKTKSKRSGVPLTEISVGKLTDCVSPNESQKSFAEVSRQVRGAYTQPTGMMTIEVTTYENERVGMKIEVGPCFQKPRCKCSHHCLVDGTTHI